MYVCACKAVTETEIELAIEQGAGNLHALQKQLGVATQCGQCASCARKMLAKRQTSESCGNADINWLVLKQLA